MNEQQRQFIDDALKLLLNLGKRENTVEDVASVINVVVYILQKVLDTPDESLTKEVLLELLLVICEHSHPDTPIIWQKACELYEKLNEGTEK